MFHGDMVSIIGKHIRVVETPELEINELAGNVASHDDTLSIALVKAGAGSAEPWLTLHYDEWLCVLKGTMVIEQEGLDELKVNAGQTVKLPKGTRFRPTFPVDTEYVPVCLPAFRPDRCIREDPEDAQNIAKTLAFLHSPRNSCTVQGETPEILYHMTTVAEWEASKRAGTAHYPKTYAQDGYYTHATGVPSRLIETANHFYTDIPGDWICLEFTRRALRDRGIHTRDEQAEPVGDKDVSEEWRAQKWICPHVMGGIPLEVVQREYPMTRDGQKFTGIKGLV